MVQEEPEEPSIMEQRPSAAESLHLVPAPEYEEPDESDSGCESSIFEDEDDVDVDELDVEEPNVEIIEQSLMMDSPPMPPPPQITPLNDSYSGRNRGRTEAQAYRRRPGDFTTIMEENTADVLDKAPVPPPHAILKPQQQQQQPLNKSPRQPRLVPQEDITQESTDLTVSTSSLDSILLGKPADESSIEDIGNLDQEPPAGIVYEDDERQGLSYGTACEAARKASLERQASRVTRRQPELS